MTILFIVSILLSLFYLGFILSIYLGIVKLSKSKENENSNFPSVTILIPFRNEEVNLARSINSINNLDYPSGNIEVIYINDNSNDKSKEVFEKLSKKDFIKLIELDTTETNKARKKFAILKGIENSKNEIIVTTDADCYFNKDWLKNLVGIFGEKTALVAGPVDLEVRKSFLGAFQKLEFAGLNLSAAGLIAIGKPIICSAANLAYRRSVFNEIGGFGKTINYSSGDDDFLLQKIASHKKWKIKFAYNRKAMVFTEGKENTSDFMNQRARWASKGFNYENILTVILLVLIFLFYLLIPVQIILLLFGFSLVLPSLIFALLIKFTSEFLVMRKGLNDLYEKSFMKYFLLAELIQIPYIILSPIIGIFGKFSWKGRSLKK